MSFVHADLKLENVLIGNEDPNEIYLIDFGLSRLYRDPETLEHNFKDQTFRFQGNFTFATKNQCGGYTTSRRDDIQSAFHILIYLLNDGSLPWLDNFSTKGKSFSVKLRERSRKTYFKQLTPMVPKTL